LGWVRGRDGRGHGVLGLCTEALPLQSCFSGLRATPESGGRKALLLPGAEYRVSAALGPVLQGSDILQTAAHTRAWARCSRSRIAPARPAGTGSMSERIVRAGVEACRS